jgi:hypothetical protein
MQRALEKGSGGLWFWLSSSATSASDELAGWTDSVPAVFSFSSCCETLLSGPSLDKPDMITQSDHSDKGLGSNGRLDENKSSQGLEILSSPKRGM